MPNQFSRRALPSPKIDIYCSQGSGHLRENSFHQNPTSNRPPHFRKIHSMLARSSSKRHYSADSVTGSTVTNDSNLHPNDFSTLAISSPAPNHAREAFEQIGWPSSDAPASLAESQQNSDYYYMPAVLPGNPPIRVYNTASAADSTQFTAQSHFYDPSLNPQPSWSFPDDHNNKGFPDSHQPFTLRPSLQQHLRQPAHKRHSSASTIASAGPSSPYTPASSSPRVIDNEPIYCPSPSADPYEYGHYLTYPYQKNITRPSQLGFQHQTHALAFQDYSNLAPHDERMHYPPHLAMAPTTMSQANSETSGLARLTSRSSNGGDDSEENAKAMKESRSIIPKFDRTMSDIYQDELYNPDAPTSAPSSQTRNNQNALLSPYRGVFSERLQAANDMRSSSPAQAIPRRSSPFRQGSESVAQQCWHGEEPTPRLGSAAQIREQQKAEADAIALARHHKPKVSELDASSTISPKEAMLDFKDPDTNPDQSLASIKREVLPKKPHDDQSGSSSFKPANAKRRSPEGNLLAGQNQAASVRRQSSSEYSQASSAQSRSVYASSSAPIPQQYPFIPQLPTQSSNMTAVSSRDPEFPAPLVSMDSTRSDTTSRSQSGRNDSVSDLQQRPSHTTADTGTYTCTCNGCSMRFATAHKLQKHRRESHRQSTPHSASTTANGGNSPIESAHLSSASGSSSALNRNSQAGPHQCRQINPTTGKPCNSVFSRPYDLTRHEDTIHNARKQKVRCHLCTDEKTFSRNDALTRHMRVVHPEVDFPGKNRRRGGK